MLTSVVGAWYVANKKPFGFWLFVLADALLMGIQIEKRIWSQVALFVAYFAMNCQGIYVAYFKDRHEQKLVVIPRGRRRAKRRPKPAEPLKVQIV